MVYLEFCRLTLLVNIKLKRDIPSKKEKMVLKNLGAGRNKDADIENGLEDMGRGNGKLGQSERVAWTYIHYQT